MGWNTRAFLDAGEYLLGGLIEAARKRYRFVHRMRRSLPVSFLAITVSNLQDRYGLPVRAHDRPILHGAILKMELSLHGLAAN